ncbi:MAG: hypothetical protein JW993_11760 [Sedimentisphaerales bacterium]|nr:hypothetical protein [Sedimentisphaerales bacterium]
MKLYAILAVVGVGLWPGAVTAHTPDEAGLDLLLDAIARVESNASAKAVGDGGRAVGAYQIHRLYWKDGTRFLGVDWSYDCAKDPVKARQVVRAYLLLYGKGRSLLDKARIHNGGPRGYRKRATLKYARKIAEILERGEEAS